MLRGVVVAFGLAVVLAGCKSSFEPDHISATFDEKAAAFALKSGTGRIEGQAFLRRDNGRVVTAAGERIFLIPATSYTIERFGRLFGGDMRAYYAANVEAPPEDYYRYRREAKVDMSGRFAFEKLAAGRYIVATRVFWTEPKSYFTHGGAVYDIVDVRDGETTTAIVSGK